MRRSFIWAVIAGASLAGCQDPSERPSALVPVAESRNAAAAGLDTLRALVTDENYQAMGFDSPAQARDATLGPALQVYVIGLEQLRAYEPGADPNALLIASADRIYPVLIRGAVKSSVTVSQAADGFRPAAFGEAAMIRAVAAAQTITRNTQLIPDPPDTETKGAPKTLAPAPPPLTGPSEEFIVRIPTLGVTFFGARAQGFLFLTPTAAAPQLGLSTVAPQPAGEVLSLLAPIARQHSGLSADGRR